MNVKKQLLLVCLSFSLFAQGQESLYDYVFFANSRMMGNYFFSATKVIAPSSVKNEDQKLPVSETIFHTPGNALQLDYKNHEKGLWSATVYKQQFRGQDHFKTAVYLSFWLYNPSPSTKSSDLPSLQLMRKDSTLSNRFSFTTTKVKEWEQIITPIKFFTSVDAAKPDDIIAIVFSQNEFSTVRRHTIYIDDIEFLPANNNAVIAERPVIKNAKGYAKHVDLEWTGIKDSSVKYVKVYRSQDGSNYLPIGIQSALIHRFADFTGVSGKTYQYKISFLDNKYEETNLSPPVTATTRKLTDDELLTMVQEACFRYYWESAEKTSGLAKENILGRQSMIASGASGFGIMALIAGTERKFITRQQSVERFVKIVNFLEKAETFHGVYPHFIDGPSGKVDPFFGPRDNGGDLVETSFLLQGLLTAKAYFNNNDPKEKLIRDKITAIWQKTEWDWYRRYPDSKYLYWHWSPDKEWIIDHRLIGWNETMVTYLLAIASPAHPVPAGMYYTGWANQDSTGQQYRANWGGTTDGSMYTNGSKYYDIKLDVGVSNGGPLFFTHYSYLGYDPHKITDRYTNYFDNNQSIARINHRYCVDNPGNYKGYGDSCWGLTASDGPYNYSADEPILRQDRGKIGPTGAISSFPYTPVQSMKALKNYYHNYGKFLWGEYGFRDAFNLTENWCSEIYMGLNQAPMVVMIENHRSGLLWNLFMSDKDIQSGLKKLAAEK
jgi:hypothetical protein